MWWTFGRFVEEQFVLVGGIDSSRSVYSSLAPLVAQEIEKYGAIIDAGIRLTRQPVSTASFPLRAQDEPQHIL